MKKLAFLTLLFLLFVACQHSTDVGSVKLGADYSEVLASLKHAGIAFNDCDENIIDGNGTVYILNIKFDRIRCEFKEGRLDKIAAWRSFSTLSASEIQDFKSRMYHVCGDGYSDMGRQIAVFGNEDENRGCIGSFLIDDANGNDCFFATIRLAN